MVYPIIVMTMAMGILCFLLVFIVPRFEVIFHDLLGDKPLPPVTQFVLGASNFMQHHGLVLLGARCGALWSFTTLSTARVEGDSRLIVSNCACRSLAT